MILKINKHNWYKHNKIKTDKSSGNKQVNKNPHYKWNYIITDGRIQQIEIILLQWYNQNTNTRYTK